MRKQHLLIIFLSIILSTSCSLLDKECEHTYSEYKTIQPTCIDKGYTYYKCDKCKNIKKEEIQPTGHINTTLDYDSVVIPTSTNNGYSGDYICNSCHKIATYGHTTTYNPSSCSNHTYIEKTISEESCTKNGTRRHYCIECGYYFDTYTSKLEHTPVLDQSTVVAATTTSTGYSGDYKCSVCGTITSYGSEIPMITDTNCDHTYTKTLSNNIVTHRCSKCNDTYTTSRYNTINISAINDFHGAIENLGYIGSYLNNKGKQDNTLIIDSGDSWQGSLESNYNYGRLINDVENYINLDVRTIGNHDFDYGIDKLIDNTSSSYNGYKMNTLAANVYDYDFDTKTTGSIQQSSIGKEYAVFTLDNNIKVGVVGVIGQDQISSITTDYVKDITFTDHIQTIKDISDTLRTSQDCDIVIASVHGGYEDTLDKGLNDISDVTNTRYCDLVLNAHTHYLETKIEDSLYHVQAKSYGQYVCDISLSYDSYLDTVTSTDVDQVTLSSIKSSTTVDSTISNLISQYGSSTTALGSTILTTKASGTFSSSSQLPNLMAEAMYKEAVNEGYNVDYAYLNVARTSINNTTWTLSNLYQAFPFDNKVYILKIKGTDMIDEVYKYNYIYRGDSSNALSSISSSKTYTIAVLDYLAYHTNSYRSYDYFKNIVSELGYLKKDNQVYNYRDILKDYMLNNTSKSFNSTDYTYSTSDYTNYRFNRSKMYTTYSSVPSI